MKTTLNIEEIKNEFNNTGKLSDNSINQIGKLLQEIIDENTSETNKVTQLIISMISHLDSSTLVGDLQEAMSIFDPMEVSEAVSNCTNFNGTKDIIAFVGGWSISEADIICFDEDELMETDVFNNLGAILGFNTIEDLIELEIRGWEIDNIIETLEDIINE